MSNRVAMAVGAHPDDIEFMMAGTLALLKQAGWETHYLNVANGSCGSAVHPAARLRAMRRREAQSAAAILGAVHHPSLVDDLDIYFERATLRRLAAVIRDVAPAILLVPSPQDYMEDHTNACRLAVTAAFVRGMRNFVTTPKRPAVEGDLTVYHAMPHGLRDPLRRRVIPGAFVNTTAVRDIKRRALAEHASQQDWLDTSQKMNRYLAALDTFGRDVGRMSRRFEHAEGWRRRLHYGFCAQDADPLREALGRGYRVNRRYEAALDRGA
jgi:LmbE family N-acetylglucosaminyl deacetylase